MQSLAPVKGKRLRDSTRLALPPTIHASAGPQPADACAPGLRQRTCVRRPSLRARAHTDPRLVGDLLRDSDSRSEKRMETEAES